MIKKINLNDLHTKAKNNTTVSKKVATREPVTLKQGLPKENIKTSLNNVVGLSKGITKNLDNFESLRVDCWLSTTINDFTKENIDDTINQISNIIDEVIYTEVSNTIDE